MNTEKKFCPFCGKPLTTMDNEGRSRLYCSEEERFVYENPIPASTGLICDESGRILLVLRNREPGKALWGLPGGFVESGENPIDAARREIEEETGIKACDPTLIDIIFEESKFYGTSLLIIGYHFARFEGSISAGDDADEASFFATGELPPLAFGSHRCLIEKHMNTNG